MLRHFLPGLRPCLPLGLLGAILLTCVSCQMFTSSKNKAAEVELVDRRLVTEPQSPFFRSLKGVNPKPSTFLDAGTEVIMLAEDDKQTFSKIRLASGTVGWIPTRLVVLKLEPAPAPEPETELDDPEADPTEALPDGNTPASPSGETDPDSPAEVIDPLEIRNGVDITIPEVNPLPIEDL